MVDLRPFARLAWGPDCATSTMVVKAQAPTPKIIQCDEIIWFSRKGWGVPLLCTPPSSFVKRARISSCAIECFCCAGVDPQVPVGRGAQNTECYGYSLALTARLSPEREKFVATCAGSSSGREVPD